MVVAPGAKLAAWELAEIVSKDEPAKGRMVTVVDGLAELCWTGTPLSAVLLAVQIGSTGTARVVLGVGRHSSAGSQPLCRRSTHSLRSSSDRTHHSSMPDNVSTGQRHAAGIAKVENTLQHKSGNVQLSEHKPIGNLKSRAHHL